MFGKRKIIVHFHIFKNAGTTIDFILHRNFQSGFFQLDRTEPSAIIPAAEGIEFIRNNKELTVLTSHQLEYPLPKQKNILIHPIFFLRHPIDRIGSIFRYMRSKDQTATSYSTMAKQMDLKQYVAWMLEEGKNREAGISNFQAWKLSYEDSPNKYQITEYKLTIAKKRLKESPFFGLVDRFDDSLLLMKKYLGRKFPGIDYSYMIQNRSSDVADTQKRIDDIKTQIGDGLFQQLIDKNEYDLNLYDYALKLFEKRLRWV